MTAQDSKHIKSSDLLPRPRINPSHGNHVNYPEMQGGQASIIIPAYPGLAIGQTIRWTVRGNGLLFGHIEVKSLEHQYKDVVNGIVFRREVVEAQYGVRQDGHDERLSDHSFYIVDDRPADA